MTNYTNSNAFLKGVTILSKYMTEELSVNVCEVSLISINGLKCLSSEDKIALDLLGWESGKDKDGGTWAQYLNLKYVDC